MPDDWRANVPSIIAGGRIAFGLTLMAAPALGARAYLGSEASRPSVRFMSRIFGGRDVAIGLVQLRALRDGRPEVASRALWLGAGCDALDALAAVRGRDLPWWSRIVVGAMGSTWAVLGAAAALAPAGPDATAATDTAG